MTVAELIAKLQQLPPDMPVLVSIDYYLLGWVTDATEVLTCQQLEPQPNLGPNIYDEPVEVAPEAAAVVWIV